MQLSTRVHKWVIYRDGQKSEIIAPGIGKLSRERGKNAERVDVKNH